MSDFREIYVVLSSSLSSFCYTLFNHCHFHNLATWCYLELFLLAM